MKTIITVGVAVSLSSMSLASQPLRDEQPVWKSWDKTIIPVGKDVLSDCEKSLRMVKVKMLDCERSFNCSSDYVRRYQKDIVKGMAEDPKFDVPRGYQGKMITRDLSTLVEGVLRARPPQVSNKEVFKEFLLKQAYADWCRVYLYFDNAIADGRFNPWKNDVGFQTMLDQKKRGTVCGGYSWAAVELAANSGYKDSYFKIEGHLRDGPKSATPTHSYVGFILADGSYCFSDPQQAAVSLKLVRSRNFDISNPLSCPLNRWEQGVFLTSHFSVSKISAVTTPANSRRLWNYKTEVVKDEMFTGRDLEEFNSAPYNAARSVFQYFRRDASSTAIDSVADGAPSGK